MIRKISIGADYKTAMHYIVGQDILGGKYKIDTIIENEKGYYIYIKKKGEVAVWKHFNTSYPVAVEFDLNY
jgi:hypothetical protein